MIDAGGRRTTQKSQNPQKKFFSACSACSALIVVLAAACGKKGPPLPPLVKLPLAPADLSAERRGDVVELRFTVPATNTDSTRPANIERAEVYAITAPVLPPPLALTDDQIVKYGTKVAAIEVKSPRNPNLTADADDPADEVDAPEGGGLDQGAAARVEEEQKLIDMDSVARAAVERVEQAGIIFIDEIDKIAGREGSHGPDVSREGVQRDILPIVEGTTVNTKYGMVRTDHILFIAAGAFHVSKPSDLIPELQGRFPIRVELEPLGKDEFVRILTEPRSALIKQYMALMDTEGITLTFTDDAIRRIADFATTVNDRTENIGARRLHTVLEKLLDEISFEGPDLGDKTVTIDEAYVTKMLADIVKNEDLSRYIL